MHKYDCIDYECVDSHLGGDAALKKLVTDLHDNDMRIILDISINHTGSNHKWFNKDAVFYPQSVGAYHNPGSPEREYYYFEGNDYTAWEGVSEMPTLNYTSGELRERVYDSEDAILLKWLKPPYNIDGWRFDVANTLAKNDDVQLADEVWPVIRERIRGEKRDAYILAEKWEDSTDDLGREGWDAAMNYYGCSRVVRSFVGETDLVATRYGVNAPDSRLRAEELAAHILSYLAGIPFALQQVQFNLLDSHDVPRLHNVRGYRDYESAVMLQFALIGTPCIYYGDEVGIDGRTDSVEGCRYPMPWDNIDSDIYAFYKRLIAIRNESAALKYGGMKILYAHDDIIAVSRFLGDERYVIVASVGDKPKSIRIPFGIIGSNGPKGDTDLLGKSFDWKKIDSRTVEMTIDAHSALFIKCL